MKRLIFFLLLGGFALTSCQKDDIGSVLDVEAVEGRGKNKEASVDESSSENHQHTEHCGCDQSEECETAFGRWCDCASSNTCFMELGLNSNRWGWSVMLKDYRTYDFGLFAGAGQCSLDKGTYVGNVQVTFNSDGSVSYDENSITIEDGFDLKDLHFYAGDTPTPINKNNGEPTVAPGQYYNEGDLDNSEGDLGEPDGVVYVIFHAEICGDYED